MQQPEKRDPNKPLSVGALETLLLSKKLCTKDDIDDMHKDNTDDKIKKLLDKSPHTEAQLLDDPMFAFEIFRLIEGPYGPSMDKAARFCGISLYERTPYLDEVVRATGKDRDIIREIMHECDLMCRVIALLRLKDKGGNNAVVRVYTALIKHMELVHMFGAPLPPGVKPDGDKHKAFTRDACRAYFRALACKELGFPQDYNFNKL